jgi:hypothetical protein
MIEKELILTHLQKQLHNTDNAVEKEILQNLIGDILSGEFNVRTW